MEDCLGSGCGLGSCCGHGSGYGLGSGCGSLAVAVAVGLTMAQAVILEAWHGVRLALARVDRLCPQLDQDLLEAFCVDGDPALVVVFVVHVGLFLLGVLHVGPFVLGVLHVGLFLLGVHGLHGLGLHCSWWGPSLRGLHPLHRHGLSGRRRKHRCDLGR